VKTAKMAAAAAGAVALLLAVGNDAFAARNVAPAGDPAFSFSINRGTDHRQIVIGRHGRRHGGNGGNAFAGGGAHSGPATAVAHGAPGGDGGDAGIDIRRR
jgi:hypothetical protein